jgi:hypothetical protein
MPTMSNQPSNTRARSRGIAVAGVSIILLSAGAALLPAEKGISADVIGALLLCAGLLELVAGSLRRETRTYAMAAGAITAFAGLLFLLNQDARFFPIVNIVIAWLFIRGALLAATSHEVHGSVRGWTIVSAATDVLLGVVLLVGLSLASVVVLLFGPTPAIVASFAWIVALSFVTTGLLLLKVASCVREASQQG